MIREGLMKMPAYIIGSMIVWGGILLATTFTLWGTPYLLQLLPILLGGMVVFTVLTPAGLRAGQEKALNLPGFLAIGSAIVWVAILFGEAIVLRGTTYFGPMLPILGAGAVWFVLLAPSALPSRGG
jgi:hypothetical protein